MNGGVLNGDAGTTQRNPTGPHFVTSVSEECASVENLDQANDVAESNSSTVSPSQSHLDFALINEQVVQELPPVLVERTNEEEILSKILTLTREMQQRYPKSIVRLNDNHNSKIPCSSITS